VRRSIGASIARTATISFATAELGTSNRPVTGLAIVCVPRVLGPVADTVRIVELEKTLTGASVALQLRLASVQAAKAGGHPKRSPQEEKAPSPRV